MVSFCYSFKRQTPLSPLFSASLSRPLFDSATLCSLQSIKNHPRPDSIDPKQTLRKHRQRLVSPPLAFHHHLVIAMSQGYVTLGGVYIALTADIEDLIGKRIDVLCSVELDDNAQALKWCQGKVLSVIADNKVEVEWDPAPDIEGCEESMVGEQVLLPSKWNKDKKDGAWRMDVDIDIEDTMDDESEDESEVEVEFESDDESESDKE